MKDAEYLFKTTVEERKRVARGARRKINGSKSKKCTLPSDFYSRKEINKMSGPVKRWDLGKPMDWETFKKMPKDLQSEYVAKLAAMGAKRKDLADMFGVSIDAFSQYMFTHHHGETPFKETRSVDKQEFEKWLAVEPETPRGLMRFRKFSVEYEGDARAIFQKVIMMTGEGTFKIKIEIEEVAK